MTSTNNNPEQNNGKRKRRSLLNERQIARIQYAGICVFSFILGHHKKKSPLIQHHIKHAMALLFVEFILIAIYTAISILALYVGINHTDIMLEYRIDQKVLIAGLILIVLIHLNHIVFSIIASKGRTPNIFILSRLAPKRWVHITVVPIFCILMTMLLVGVGCAIHASAITPSHSDSARVYMLYDDSDGMVPQLPMAFAFYPVTLKARSILGEDSVCVKPLTNESFREAFSKGDFIFIASHGCRGKILLGSHRFYAADALLASDGHRPAFIYLTGCDISRDNNLWTNTFPETRLITFDRWCCMAEHYLWLLFHGADTLEQTVENKNQDNLPRHRKAQPRVMAMN